MNICTEGKWEAVSQSTYAPRGSGRLSANQHMNRGEVGGCKPIDIRTEGKWDAVSQSTYGQRGSGRL